MVSWLIFGGGVCLCIVWEDDGGYFGCGDESNCNVLYLGLFELLSEFVSLERFVYN